MRWGKMNMYDVCVGSHVPRLTLDIFVIKQKVDSQKQYMMEIE